MEKNRKVSLYEKIVKLLLIGGFQRQYYKTKLQEERGQFLNSIEKKKAYKYYNNKVIEKKKRPGSTFSI